jgi:hypothetical protein
MSETTDTDVEIVTEDDTTTDEWVPPTKEEWEDLVARKNRADSEAASRKRWLRDLGYDPKTGQKLASAPVGAVDGADDEEGTEGADKPSQVDTAVLQKAAFDQGAEIAIALAEAGVGPKSLKRVSKMIDGSQDITAQIDALKDELPELFKKSRTTSVSDAALVSGGKKQAPASSQNKDYRQLLAERILGS